MEQSTFPIWDVKEPVKSANAMYQWAEKNAFEQINWYIAARRSKRLGSQSIRIATICFTGLGSLCPLVIAAGVKDGITFGAVSISLGQLGYIFLALAALVFSYDKYFGLSSGWMRYMTTQAAIQKALSDFQFDWNIITSQQATDQPSSLALLQRAKEFSVQANNLVKSETDAWVLEFQNNIAQLEKLLQSEPESKRPGSIKVAITNTGNFDRFSVTLDGQPKKELGAGILETILTAVSPGAHELGLTGFNGNQEVRTQVKVVEVQANTMAVAEIVMAN